jgi:hypothetical protein
LAFSPICGGKWGGAIITKFCTRVKVDYVMASAIFRVDVSRFTDSVEGRKSGFPICFRMDLTTAALPCCRDTGTFVQWRRHMGALGARAPPEKLNCRNFEAD